MSNTAEYNCETLEIALLAAQSGLSALNTAGGIVHFDKATQTSAATIDRIVVESSPREIAIMGLQEGVPKVYNVNVKVTVEMATNDVAAMDAYILAVEAANTGTPPAGVVTSAAALFPSGGPEVYSTSDGERSAQENERIRSKTFRFVFNA